MLNNRLAEITNRLGRGEGGYDEFLKVRREMMESEKEAAKGRKIRAGKVMDEVGEGSTTFHMNAERERIVNNKNGNLGKIV